MIIKKFKIILVFLLIQILIINIGLTNNSGISKETATNTGNRILELNLFPKQSNIENVFGGFCNNGLKNIQNEYILEINPGIKKQLCFVIGNKSDKNIIISLNINKQTISNLGSPACDLNDLNYPENNLFNQIFPETVTIPANGYITKNINIKTKQKTGEYNLCISYIIIEKEKEKIGGALYVNDRKINKFKIIISKKNYLINKIRDLSTNNNILYTILILSLLIFIISHIKERNKKH